MSKKAVIPSATGARRKRAPSKARKATSSSATHEVVIRMYNVGFGDSFLVTIQDGADTRRMLFDCGSIAAGPTPISDSVDEIIAACTDAKGNAHFDVIVATHRHKDHVSGFALDSWSGVSVSEVWMPWTEDPRDADAARIRKAQSKLTAALAVAVSTPALDLPRLSLEPDGHPRPMGSVPELVLNAMSNAKAMDTLHGGFGGNAVRRFLPERRSDGALIRTFETAVLPKVKIHVLGPSHDPSVIAEMNPPKGESYLRLRDPLAGGGGTACRPFAEEYLDSASIPIGFEALITTDDRSAVEHSGGMSDFDAAAALDTAINGTSLMLVLEIGKAVFLFPGDAQWGTWNMVLGDSEWRQLLGRTTFYKVGHHGSHNATPVDFVESTIEDGIVGMASTIARSQWPNIPKGALLDALEKKKAIIARSDKDGAADKGTFSVEHEHFIETRFDVS